MNVKTQTRTYKIGESVISAISVGAILILIGMAFVLAQPSSLWDSLMTFARDLTLDLVPGTLISLPAPANPATHTVLYTAAFQFFIGLGILQILLLLIRLMIQSPIAKTAETFGSLVYWFGASYLVSTYLNNTTTINEWFMFWAGTLITLGFSLVARAIVLFIKRK